MIYVLDGGGLSNAFAVISVTYPAGSTCTCIKGTRTLTAKGTSGAYLFAIPEAGTWTLSCNGKTKTVNVTSYGQTFEVAIALSFYIIQDGAFKNGASFSPVTSPAHGSVTAKSGYIEHKTSAAGQWDGRAYRIDVTSYNTLSVEWQQTNAELSATSLAIFNAIGISDTQEAITANVAAETHPSRNGSRVTTTLSLSGLSGNKYVGVGLLGISAAATSQIYNLWLE